MTKPAIKEQIPLERPKCADPCTLLSGHPGRCVTEGGKYIKR